MSECERERESEKKVVISEEEPDCIDGVTLMDELSGVLESITGDSGRNSFNVKEENSERSVFIIARNQEGIGIGCGAIRQIDDKVGEIKRVYAKHQGLGIGTQLLNYLENRGRELGYSELWLETRLVNTSAVEFYKSKNYHIIPNYGKYKNRPEAVCFKKCL